MTMHTKIQIQTDDFQVGDEYEELKCESASYGAIVTFTGIVREQASIGMKAMFLEHYPGMTEKSLANIVELARERWPLGKVTVIHRVGQLDLNDNIVFVGVASAHRVAAFDAAQFIMDYLKRDAPFWKKELGESSQDWVEQKASDLDAAKRW